MSTMLEVIVLRDNLAVRADLRAGHGFALLARVPGGSFLLDTGDSDETWANADALGVDLAEVHVLVLSHGHYDHTGGLPGLIERHGGLRVIAHPLAFEPRWSTSGGIHPIGPPLTRAALETAGCRVECSAKAVEVLPGVRTTGEVPRVAGRGPSAPHLLAEHDGMCVPDDFADDLSVVVDVGEAVVVLTGCAHAGLLNIVARAEELAGRSPVAIIGGTHLASEPEPTIAEIADELHRRGVRTLVPMHCTGERGATLLARHFPGKVLRAGTGSIIAVENDGSLTTRTA